MVTERTDGSHYWYGQTDQERGRRVLEAMRAYRAADSAMRRRTQEAMGMGENDLLAMRYLLRSQQQGKDVAPKELAQYLGISSASVTALLDRLERSGHLRREPSPFDRRGLIVVPTVSSDEEVRKTLGDMHERMIAVASELDPDTALAVVDFLDRLRESVDTIYAPDGAPEHADRDR
ncbi:transcriptional regulator [Cnuibacter physcomitrellae]|uniref:MarR family winged helix-turn-helix transcriptional regulator n=1 Tax=Cnuibacter physcomitrellae TaxID=1619308 RepID=UPI00157D1944|nr:MarR family transcriptional regulator [Cnuibacter physcomitrellae]GGI37282.1 transcriptional regulator [Cnuibacter physcomitrellae]